MALYARACRTSPPPAAPFAAWLVELVWDGPGWPEVRLAEFAPALGAKGLTRVADLVTERTAAADPDSWREQWAAQYLREQLAAASGDIDAYVAVLAENLKHTDRYRVIATVLSDAARPADAVGWARRGLADHPTNPFRRPTARPPGGSTDRPRRSGGCAAGATSGLRAPPDHHRLPRPVTIANRVGADPRPVTEWALDDLRDRHRIRPTFLRKLAAGQDKVTHVRAVKDLMRNGLPTTGSDSDSDWPAPSRPPH
jgi:hypothetical protein